MEVGQKVKLSLPREDGGNETALVGRIARIYDHDGKVDVEVWTQVQPNRWQKRIYMANPSQLTIIQGGNDAQTRPRSSQADTRGHGRNHG